jgi:hypothetical protein
MSNCRNHAPLNRGCILHEIAASLALCASLLTGDLRIVLAGIAVAVVIVKFVRNPTGEK